MRDGQRLDFELVPRAVVEDGQRVGKIGLGAALFAGAQHARAHQRPLIGQRRALAGPEDVAGGDPRVVLEGRPQFLGYQQPLADSRTGASASATVTVWLQVSVLPAASLAVQAIVVTPLG